ncbi:MAG: substrate-binding domain-containing protein [Phycisphaerae bacterium]
MDDERVIGVHLATDTRHGREMLLGILDYRDEVGTLRVERHDPHFLRRRARSGALCGAVVICTFDSRQALRRVRLPMVNVSAQCPPDQMPSVISDDYRIGQIAGEYFRDRGYLHGAWAGIPGHYYSRRRREGFAETLEAVGGRLHDLDESTGNLDGAGEIVMALRTRLVELPRPLAVFACNDMRARLVARACDAAGLTVPEEVAILGVDDDEVTCRLVRPSLSSIHTHTRRIGYTAARLLDDLLAGQAPPSEPIEVGPLSVSERLSSDAYAVSDPLLADALRWIRQNVRENLKVEDVLDEFGVSRRTLELKFHKELGRTPLEEIRRSRIERAKTVLAETAWPMPRVAELAGFLDAKGFGTIFRRYVGMAPTEYRRKAQGRQW